MVGLRKSIDLTRGSIPGRMLQFALPLMVGNLLQQLYNIVDTIIVGRYLGQQALAAVGSSYTLMIFLTSILCGLCMGSGVCWSVQYGSGDSDGMQQSFYISFLSIAGVTAALNLAAYALLGALVRFMQIPQEAAPYFTAYLRVIFAGLAATFLYNYLANLLRAVGNSVIPLVFLGVSAVSNAALDLLFVLGLGWGVTGAAAATVAAQYLAGLGIAAYYTVCCRALHPESRHRRWSGALFRKLAVFSLLTGLQQSIMNFGILLVQGLVNSFGTVVMAAFAAGVKIDTLAYAPVQDFGNAFSTYIAQNYGAGRRDRIRKGCWTAGTMVVCFCAAASLVVCLFAGPLMTVFVDAAAVEIIAAGKLYLRIEGACYVGIGILFLLYGYFRAMQRPWVSVLLTVISLGTRVVLAYLLSALPVPGVAGIWLAIPIGWLLADLAGLFFSTRRAVKE